MKTKLLFSWDITLLLVIASFVYVCFDKVMGLLALIAVSRDHPTIDVIPLLNNLTNLNGGYSEKLMGLVGTFFTIVLAGNLFKSQQANNTEQSSAQASQTSQPSSVTTTHHAVEFSRNQTAARKKPQEELEPESEPVNQRPAQPQPLITKIPEE